MIYGTPALTIDDDQTDRIGIRTLILSRMWQPSHWPMGDAELQQEKPATPELGGGMLLIGDQTRRQGGALRTSWTFEGIHGDGKSVTFKDREHSNDFAFSPGFEATDIRKHPLIQKLLDNYGGVVDPASQEIIWPLTISSGGSGGGGLTTNTDDSQGGGTVTSLGLGAWQSKGSEKRNPMFGRNEFFQITGTYTFRYAAFNPPTDSGVNRIHRGGLPGQPPKVAKCDWLKAPSPFRRRGVVCDITEIYWLSGPGGWPVPIHQLA